jgi:hypothetical protein
LWFPSHDQRARKFGDLESRIEAMTKPKDAEPEIDIFADPNAYTESIKNQLQSHQSSFDQKMRHATLTMSLQMAQMMNPEEFPKAYEAFTAAANSGNQAVQARVFNSPNQGLELISWYRETEALKEFGTDPTAYRQKTADELLKDPGFLQKAFETYQAQATGQQGQLAPNTTIDLPPSLKTMPGTAASSEGAGQEHLTEEQRFAKAAGA